MGWQDEIQAGLGATFDVLGGNIPLSQFGDQYTALRDQERAQQAAWRGENPKKAFAAELAGGFALPGAGGVRGAQAAGKGLAGIGAIEGGLAGAGLSEDTGLGLAQDTALGGGLGALTAIAAPAIIGKGTEFVGGAGRIIRDQFGDQTDRQVRNLLELAMERDNLTLEQAMRRLDELGPEGMLADVGQNLRKTGEVQVQRGGPALRIATENLEARQGGRASRLADNLEETTGRLTDEYQTVRRNAQAVRKEIAGPLYDEAFKQPLRKTDELMNLARTERLQEAIREAQSRTGGFGKPSGGELQILDETKRVLWDFAEKAKRDGQMGLANDYNELRRRLVAELDLQSPEYKQARNLFAGTKEIEDAAEIGSEVFRGTKTMDDVVEVMEQFGES